MPFDPYALCPGGRDKKIRFCCPNMLKEIEQVERLLESKQTSACLAYIESLEKKHTDCACLTAAKLTIYRAENRWQEALSIAEQFLVREPDNPTAAAEYALALTVTGNPQLAVSTLVDAFERSTDHTVHSTLLHTTLQVSGYLFVRSVVLPALAIGHVLKEIPATAEQANMFLFRATSENSIPLLLRDWSFDFNCPDNLPEKDTFDEIAVLVRMMYWKQALSLLETLIPHADAWSGIWHNIATVRLWLLDNEKGCEALKTYASLPNVPLEDAADAETLRLLFTPDPLGDQTESLTVEYTITDTDKVLEKLLSDPYFRHIDILERMVSPPPRGGFMVHDRPMPHPDAALTLDNIPSYRSIAVLFGKETDREARLMAQAFLADEQDSIEAKFREVLGDLIQIPGEVVTKKPISMTRTLMECRFVTPSLDDSGRESIQHLVNDYYTTLLPEQWLAMPLGLLDGQTPGEAAKEPKYTVSLLAMINMIESWTRGTTDIAVASTLRTRLGLPEPGTITVVASPEEDDPLAALDAYPVWRWHRFEVASLSTETLADGLQIVLGMHELRAASRFAEELLNRPVDSMEFPVRIMAFEVLIAASQESGDFEQALLWVERGKSETAMQNISDAAWYLHEITLQLMNKNAQGANDAIRYLTTHYGNDAEVMRSLQELFVQLGLMNPDGTPSAAASRMMAEKAAQPAEPTIWTPDSAAPAGNAAASKLWVPD